MFNWILYLIWYFRYRVWRFKPPFHLVIKPGKPQEKPKKGDTTKMADFVLQDNQEVTLSLSLVDVAGNPVGALPPGVTVAWATANDPTSSLAITPSADTLSCLVVANGPLATGAQVTATATLPPSTAATTALLAIDVVVSAAVGFSIVPGTPTTKP